MKKGLEGLEDLPYKRSMKYRDKTGDQFYYDRGRGPYKKINGRYAWTHVDRVLKKFKGKNVNKAFSYYCSVVDKCQQFFFWDELKNADNYSRMSRWYRSYDYWYVDSQNRVQRKKVSKKNTTYVIYSHDAKWGYVNVKTGKPVPDWNDGYWRRRSGGYYMDDTETEYRLVEGQQWVFKKKGPAYHRCFAEQLTATRKAEKERNKEIDKKISEMMPKQDKKPTDTSITNMERLEDIMKMGNHGFDENSFESEYRK